MSSNKGSGDRIAGSGFLGSGFVGSREPKEPGTRYPKPDTQRGYTFVELIVVATIIAILASAIMPLAKVTAQRTREAELRRSLREIRTAIDKYKDAADAGQIGSLDIKV